MRFIVSILVLWIMTILSGCAAKQDLMPDFLHPNEAGYRVWAEAMALKIEELLAE